MKATSLKALKQIPLEREAIGYEKLGQEVDELRALDGACLGRRRLYNSLLERRTSNNSSVDGWCAHGWCVGILRLRNPWYLCV